MATRRNCLIIQKSISQKPINYLVLKPTEQVFTVATEHTDWYQDPEEGMVGRPWPCQG